MKNRGKRGTFLRKINRKKKGLSTVVVTLIIILLSLVAVGVVWVVVRNIITTGSKQITLGQLTINLGIESAYQQNGNINVDVKRNAGSGQLLGIKFILFDGTNSEVITKNTTMGELEENNFVLTPTNLDPTHVQTISVVPVFEGNDGSQMVGSVSDTYNIATGQSYNSGNNNNESNNNNGNNNNTNGNNNSQCTPDCTNLQCGNDPICGQSCGTCSGNDNCTNGVCVAPACIDESNATTCGTWTCGTKINNCGKLVTCGSNNGNCPVGQICNSGSCIAVTPVNTGHVNETWPGTSAMYFGSKDLPKTTSYQGDYISFPGSLETGCRLIVIYDFPPSQGYPYSHIGFNSATKIVSGDSYSIWASSADCQASIS